MTNTRVSELPNNLEIEGILCIGSSKIKKLPKGLKVGTLSLGENSNKNIKIPPDAIIGKIIISEDD